MVMPDSTPLPEPDGQTASAAALPDLDDKTLAERARKILIKLSAQDWDEAVDMAEALVKAAPGRAEPYYLFGLAAAQIGDSGRAVELIRHAHEIDPDCRDYADTLSVIYTQIGKLTEGLYFAKLRMALEPHPLIEQLTPPGMDNYFRALSTVKPPRHLVSAMMAFNQHLFKKAADYCAMALRIDSDDPRTHLLLAQSLIETHAPERAASALHTVIHMEPDHMEARLLLADCLDRLGRRDEADAVRETACSLDPDSSLAAYAVVRAAPFRPGITPERIRAAEDRAAERLSREPAVAEPNLMESPPAAPAEKRRIGYIGSKFFDCPETVFFRDVIASHRRTETEVYCYQHAPGHRNVITQIETAVDNWRETSGLDPEVVASIIAGDGIDGLVDLSGGVPGAPVTELAVKPARIQIGWLNHIDGAGSKTVDLILSDPMTEDLDTANLREGQSTVLIKSGILALKPPAVFEDVGESPARESGRVTFGAAADFERVNADVVRRWAEILHATPGSRLVLRAPGADSSAAEGLTGRIIEMFSHFGAVKRIMFFHSEKEMRVDPEFFAGIDIYLDTFPVSLPEDAALSLWAGAPAVTLKGPTRLGRLGASVLNSAGCAQWIAEDEDGYVDIAVKLARDIKALAETRAGLREAVSPSPLFNPAVLAAAIDGSIGMVLPGRDGGN